MFDNNSHGFRPYRSCHTALSQIKKDFTGTVWFIEGDITGCFDNIDHNVLIGILAKKIKDSKFLRQHRTIWQAHSAKDFASYESYKRAGILYVFPPFIPARMGRKIGRRPQTQLCGDALNLIRQFLKAGYVENWKYNKTYSGTPQGGICSPILANIYLNELDMKFREMKAKFDRPRSKNEWKTPEYREIDNEMKKISYWIDHTTDREERGTLIEQYKALKKRLNTIPCHQQTNKKFTFVRYADDWLVGVCGTKAECEALKVEIADFLSNELHLELSEEKTHITHSSKDARFLGYNVSVRRCQKIKGFKMKSGKRRKSRTLHLKVALKIPHSEKIERFLFAKKIIIQTSDGRFKPVHRAALLNMSDSEIVEHYNAEARGLLNYYNLAVDYHTLDYFCYLMEYSCLKTLACKHKSSVRKMIRQYKDGKTWSVPYETVKGTKRVRPVKVADCKKNKANAATDIVFSRTRYAWKSTIRQRLNARICELCGTRTAELYEVHVVRNLSELGNLDWELAMKAKRRKTLVVCPACHNRIHGR